MSFKFTKEKIAAKELVFLIDSDADKGIERIVKYVAKDMEAVFGQEPKCLQNDASTVVEKVSMLIIVGIDGQSKLISSLASKGVIDSSKVHGKREVYSIDVIDNLKKMDLVSEGKNKASNISDDVCCFDSAIVITGSDKRGVIYGLFKLSELLGVSPFINWLKISPKKKRSFTLDSRFRYLSKEPSVKFRGFFINDEWPAFGNFAFKNYGGFTKDVYEKVFELLLRLKGNYLWPAMWSSVFSEEGPGLDSAILADEMGVIMGASHHEPCLRYGEEYKHVRGKDSIYGDAWNFLTNEKGITRFWEDGLKRSGKFENVVTVGMRGEADTAIMGEKSTLKDNIDLLRKVLRTQNSLIKKYVNEDLDKVPRMLALYKEVEPFFYGDENTKGLMGDPELDGVTLMFCDDNHGNLRTVPSLENRDHKGGYGMYYHFDYHGLPRSFEWFNTSYLPKTWEQMSAAYDFGIRELWIVNVGDIFTNEYPLSFFLDMAYDFDKWGTKRVDSPKKYTENFVQKSFGELVSASKCKEIEKLLLGYTKLTGKVRTEAMNSETYEPFAYNECQETLDLVNKLMSKAQKFMETLPKSAQYGFYELVYLPLMGTMNVQKMWLLTTLNNAYASFGSTVALSYVEEIEKCLDFDKKLVDKLHSDKNGRWYGMGMSEHIGFNNWGEEECYNPIVSTFRPSDKLRLIVSVPGTNQHTEGKIWTGRRLTIGEFLNPDCSKGRIALTTASKKGIEYKIATDGDFITLSKAKGKALPNKVTYIDVTIDREKYLSWRKNISIDEPFDCFSHKISRTDENPMIVVFADNGNGNDVTYVPVRCPINIFDNMPGCDSPANTYLWCGSLDVNLGETMTGMPSFTRVDKKGAMLQNYISMEACHYSEKKDGLVPAKLNFDGVEKTSSFREIPLYGKTLSAVKAYPQDVTFETAESRPVLKYNFVLPEDGDYVLSFYTNPSNPNGNDNKLEFMYSVDGGKTIEKCNMIPDDFKVADGNMSWQKGVVDQIRITNSEFIGKKGLNVLEISPFSPNFVLEKIVIYKKGVEPMKSYLGPKETFYIK